MSSPDSSKPFPHAVDTGVGRMHAKRTTDTKRHPARRRRWLLIPGIIIGVLVVLQLVASPIAKSLINRKLANLPGYKGSAEGVNVAFWRAGINVTDFKFAQEGHEKEPPLLHVKKASMRFAPGALLKGKLGGAALIEGLELNVLKDEKVDEDKKPSDQVEQKIRQSKEQVQRWQQVLREALPITLSRLEVKNARLQFVDRSHQPNVNVGINDLHIIATDLQNRPKADGDSMPARVDVTGVMTGNGKLKISLRLDPVAKQPLFSLNFEIRELQLPPLNSFLRAYADADVSRGSFELFSEINAKGGAYDGYVKPLFHDLDFKNASDEDKNLAERVKETVVSAVATVFKNKERDQVATKAPFAGNFAQNDVDIWTTIVNLLRNAFVQAIRGGLEGQTPSR
jgi:hypothetical protein